MKTNERNIQMTDNRVAGGAALVAVILIATVLLAFTWVQPAFAAEEGQSVTITIKAGEHGSVNGKTGEFMETVSLGKEVNFTIECEEGYLIGRVLLNDEPLSADDLKELLGTTTGGLELEELDTDLTLEIMFMTSSEYEIQKKYGQVADDLSGDDTTDGSDSQQEQDTSGDNGTADAKTNPVEDTTGDDPDGTTADPDYTDEEPAGTSANSADSGSSDTGSDTGDNVGVDSDPISDDVTSENQDSQNNTSEGEIGTETDNSTDQNTTDDMSENSKNADSSADNDADVTAGEESSSDAAGTGTTETTKQATGIRNETTDSVDATTADSVKDNSDSTDDGKGDYYDTPKTGDVRNPYIWLAICIGGLIMLVISAGNMIRRATRDRNGRWGK